MRRYKDLLPSYICLQTLGSHNVWIGWSMLNFNSCYLCGSSHLWNDAKAQSWLAFFFVIGFSVFHCHPYFLASLYGALILSFHPFFCVEVISNLACYPNLQICWRKLHLPPSLNSQEMHSRLSSSVVINCLICINTPCGCQHISSSFAGHWPDLP